MPLERVGGTLAPRRRQKHRRTATPQKPFGGAKATPARNTAPKPRQQPFLDPYARAQAEFIPGYESGAASLASALANQAGYEVGRVRNRQAWQEQTLQPFAGHASDVYNTQSHAVTALSNALKSATEMLGQGLSSDISGKLSGIQAPGAAVSTHGGAPATTGQGAGGAIGGLGAADATMLSGLGGAYSEFAGGLPRIAGLAGDAAARDIAQAAANQYATEMAQRESQLQHDLIEGERYWTERQDAQKAAAAKRIADLRAAGQQAAADRLEYLQKMADKRSDQTGYIWVVKGNKIVPTKVQTLAGIKASGGTAELPRVSTTLSAGNHYLTDVYGKPILGPNGKPQPYTPYVAPSKGGKGGGKKGYYAQGPDGWYWVPSGGGKPQLVTPTGGGDKPKPLGTPKQLSGWRAYARQTVAGAKGVGDGLADVIDELMKDPDAGPPAVWGPVVASAFGLTPNLPKNLAKYPPIRTVQLARKLGMEYDWQTDGRSQDPTQQEYRAAVTWLAAQYKQLFPKAGAARGGRVPAGLTASYGFTRGGLAAPLPGRGQAGSWGYADPEGQDGRHMAIDWFAPADTSVVVPEGGVVIEARYDPRTSGQIFGGTVKVRTRDGRVWVFRHTNPAHGIRAGMSVAGGTPIGLVAPWTGSTHSHVELWRTEGGGYHAANMINPLTYLYGNRDV